MIKKNVILFEIVFLLVLLPLHSIASESGHFIDDLGRDVYVPSSPKRIISLAPSVTEILFALGLEDRIAGVTNYCNYPPSALKKEKVGNLLTPSVEKIISLSPDLVVWISEGDTKPTFEKLERLGLPLFIINAHDIKSLMTSISSIGMVCRCEDRADKLVESLKERLENIEKKTSGLKQENTLFLLDINPLISVSGGTFIDELIRFAGGYNVAGKGIWRYPRIGWEDVVGYKPEIIIVAAHTKEITEKMGGFREMPAVKATPAYVNGRIYIVDGDIVSRISPRIIDGIEAIAELIHPEAFK